MIFQDNHSTIVMEEDTVRKEFQEDLIVRKPNITIYRCCPTERYIRTVRIPGDLCYHCKFSISTLSPPPASDLGKNNRALWL